MFRFFFGTPCRYKVKLSVYPSILKNDETYGIFHMLVGKSFQFTQPNLWTIPYVRGWLRGGVYKGKKVSKMA